MGKRKIEAVVLSESALEAVKKEIYRQFESVGRFIITVPDGCDPESYRREWRKKFGKAYAKKVHKYIKRLTKEFAEKK